MAFLSDRSIAPDANGYIHIIIPNAGSPTGFDSFRISKDLFLESVTDELSDVSGQVSINESAIGELENISSRRQYVDQVNPFQYSQPANSLTYKILAKGANNGETLKIGTSLGGSEIDEVTFSTEYGLKYILEPGIDLWPDSNTTIFFTPTGTVSVEIHRILNTI